MDNDATKSSIEKSKLNAWQTFENTKDRFITHIEYNYCVEVMEEKPTKQHMLKTTIVLISFYWESSYLKGSWTGDGKLLYQTIMFSFYC